MFNVGSMGRSTTYLQRHLTMRPAHRDSAWLGGVLAAKVRAVRGEGGG